jgi:CARDB
MRGPKIPAALIMGLTFACTGAFLTSQSNAAKRKPDLIVTSAKQITQYVFRNQTNTVTWKDTTKNRGSATAGRSVTSFTVGSLEKFRRVPALAPGEVNSKKTSFESDFPSAAPGNWAYRRYCPSTATADGKKQVRESNENNNDRNLIFGCIDVLPRSLSIGIDSSSDTGSEGFPDWHERVEGTLRFVFIGYDGQAAHYKAESGSLTYTASGNSFGCSMSGSALVPEEAIVLGDNELVLSVGNTSYTADAEVDATWHYPVTCTSSEGTAQIDGPANHLYFRTNQEGVSPAPTFSEEGFESLEGSYTDPGSPISWTWGIAPNDS